MKIETFDCDKCRPKQFCIWCGGIGFLSRETCGTEERQKNMAIVGAKYGPRNLGRRWTKKFSAPRKQRIDMSAEARDRRLQLIATAGK